VTHGQNLRKLLHDAPALEAKWLDVPFEPRGSIYHLPPMSFNWSLRGSLYARRKLLGGDWPHLDAAFVHTMTISLLANPYYKRVPTVISVDATPVNLDSLAGAYSHKVQPRLIEQVKRSLTRKALSLASGYVSWSEWAKQSLVSDYGVPADEVLVVAPGTDLALFRKDTPRRDGLPRILFVGGDFVRKGGDVLLEAFRQRLRGKAELHLVTGHPVPAGEGIFTYAGLPPNSAPLVDLFRNADVFALPTRADCLAVVLGEAMASSLPIVTTNVGAHSEAVVHGRTGFIVEPGDVESLADALERLVDDPSLCRSMGEQARALAEERFDAGCNALKVVEMMQSLAGGKTCAGW
jgi:glycosyltransferase involved in cell wall biosynthesis